MKIWRPYTQEMTAQPQLLAQSAEGAHIVLDDGRRLFDGISSWWLITHGHSHPRIQAAIRKQLESLHQVVFANFTHPVAERFSDALAEFLPSTLNRVFFSDNGSTAVEVAMKAAYQFARQTGHPNRRRFLVFEHSYHGDTCGVMSVSKPEWFTENYPDLLFEVHRCKQGQSPSDPLSAWTADALEKIETSHGNICAVIIEPLVQGAGGMIVWPADAVKMIAAAARAKGIPVIFDEVMTGFGRTGTLFAFEQLDVIPDFLCLSKGLTGGFLPMGVTVTRSEIYEAFSSLDAQKMLFHGHSFTGNALSCAAALANLEIWRDENPKKRLSAISTTQETALRRMSSRLPLRNLRVCGTIGAFDWFGEVAYGGDVSRRIFSRCLERGLFLRPLGPTIYLMPPYCATDDEIVNAWETVESVLTAMLHELRSAHSKSEIGQPNPH